MCSERGPIQFFSLSQWMANGTCHMLIFSRIQKIFAFASILLVRTPNCLFYWSVEFTLRRLFIISNGELPSIELQMIYKIKNFELVYLQKENCNRFEYTVAAGGAVWRDRANIDCFDSCRRSMYDRLWVWTALIRLIRHNQITLFSTWRRYEHSMSILVSCLSHCFRDSIDLSTPHFHNNFYLYDLTRESSNFCQSKLKFSFFFLFRIIVGAPLADTSRIQAGVSRGGAVYRCDIAEDNRCRIIPFDSEGKQIVCHFSIIISNNN